MAEATAESLFLKYQRKYSEIKFVPGGYFSFQDNINFVLRPKRVEGDGELPHWGISTLNVFDANLKFTFKFKPKIRRCNVSEQLLETISQAVESDILSKRRFFLVPNKFDVAKVFGAVRASGNIGFHLRVKGPPLKGLDVNESSGSWEFFVPENSPEGKEIEAAVKAGR